MKNGMNLPFLTLFSLGYNCPVWSIIVWSLWNITEWKRAT